MADHAQFKFSAFLSYAHADARWGAWLHKRLEGYKLDRELVGRMTPRGPVPKTLRPIFKRRIGPRRQNAVRAPASKRKDMGYWSARVDDAASAYWSHSSSSRWSFFLLQRVVSSPFGQMTIAFWSSAEPVMCKAPPTLSLSSMPRLMPVSIRNRRP